MKEATQAVIVDPIADSRAAVQRLFATFPDLHLADACSDYQSALGRVGEIKPDLVLVNIDEDPLQAIGLIQALAAGNPGMAILPASRVRDSSIILRVIRAGAREFLPLPASAEELKQALDRLLVKKEDAGPKAPMREKGPQIIAVTGAAGGLGCTTVAVNLATTFAKTSTDEIVLVDFDLMLGSVDACLDIIPEHNLQGVVQNLDRLDLTLLKRSMTRHASGLYVLPHPAAMEDSAKIDHESLRRVLTLLKSAFTTVVIDTSKGLQSSDFVAFEMADLILIVVQLDLTCLRNTARLLQLFHQFEGFPEKVKLVGNRAGSQESEISLKKAQETLKLPIQWQIPNATKVVHAARARGVPIDVVGAGSRVHQSILEVAKGIRPATALVEDRQRRGLFAAFF